MTNAAQQKTTNRTSTLTSAIAPIVMAAGLALAGVSAAAAGDSTSEIDLVYVWTAKPGMNEQLVATYDAVGDVLKDSEPGLLAYEITVSEKGDQIVIHEVFEDSEALAFHLSGTAAQYFPKISEIAVPGPFIFRGKVPEELKAAAYNMNMGAIFTTEWNGFERGK